MRQQPLTGFVLHQKRYRERSHIVYLFSQEYGKVDGVLRQQPPAIYHPVSVFATGKSSLKNFSQIEQLGQPFYLQHSALFAGFYLNEVLLKLLPSEEAMPETFLAYASALEQLKILPLEDPHHLHLKRILRQFEYIFLAELGYAIDFYQDTQGQRIDAQRRYQFIANEGLQARTDGQFAGQDLQALAQCCQSAENFSTMQLAQLNILAKLQRIIIDQLLEHKPLKSRQLWLTSRGGQ